ncbi:MAG: leucine-rich repeat protein [Faecalibacterium sp.]
MFLFSGGSVLDILPLSGGRARLVRVYGDSPCVCLPAAVPAPDGSGPLALTELGGYCFSESARGLPPADSLCRYALDASGTASLLSPTAEPAPDSLPLHPVCGNFVEEVILPDSLQLIGSCAFYNCRKLRRLCAGAGSLTLGSDVFLNCFALETLVIRAAPDQPTGLFALVNNITEHVSALFWPQDAPAPLAGFWYPAYWEDIEESPAHILLHTFSGQGYHYRQCFLSNRLLSVEYDAIFPQGHDSDDAAVMAMLCFYRLRWPWQLSEAARTEYRGFLARNTGRVLSRLLKAQDLDAIRALLELDVFDDAAFAEGVQLAARADNASAAALLADAEHRYQAARAPRRKRYDFDF